MQKFFVIIFTPFYEYDYRDYNKQYYNINIYKYYRKKENFL